MKKIREDIIREREEAMAQFKFFENPEKPIREIGFYKKVSSGEKK